MVILMKKDFVAVVLILGMMTVQFAGCNDVDEDVSLEAVKIIDATEVAVTEATTVITEVQDTEAPEHIGITQMQESDVSVVTETTEVAASTETGTDLAENSQEKGESEDVENEACDANLNKDTTGRNCKDESSEEREKRSQTENQQPACNPPKEAVESKSYNPENVVSLATEKCQQGGMILVWDNLDRLYEEGKITKEEYNEYYPWDGLEDSYYSVFVNTDLNKAATTSGSPLGNVDEIADYIAEMMLLESDSIFAIEYAGIHKTNGTEFYEFRCHR